MHVRESFVTVEDGNRVFTKTVGGGGKQARPPLLVLHGGPGMGHDYLEPLGALASDEQPVVFYDQLGCGRSDQPAGPSRWQLPRFVAEVQAVRDALGLDSLVLYGQSWGGMLAIEYLLTRPRGVRGVILSNSLSSAPLFESEVLRLKNSLPAPVVQALNRHEAAGTLDSPDYRAAQLAFYSRHILRMDPFPAEIAQAMEATNEVYEVMWGKNEFSVTGNLRSWDRTEDLAKIDSPVQLISGEFDESTPRVNDTLYQGLRHVTWTLLPGCSHLSHLENPEMYLAVVQSFLDRINGSSGSHESGKSD